LQETESLGKLDAENKALVRTLNQRLEEETTARQVILVSLV
jgi:hypothetical protein